MTNPLVSIILPVYNGQQYLSLSIESCLNQTYRNIELIIVHDCSTDSSLEIIKNYALKDNRIVVINNTENKKLPASLNIGHRAAKGALLTWTSHDNIYERYAIQELSKPILSGEADIVYSNTTLIDSEGKIKRQVQLPEMETLIFGNCINASFIYKKEVYERNVAYDENLFLVEDYDFWLRAFKHSKYIHLNQTLYQYRSHNNSLTSDINLNQEKKLLFAKNCKIMYSSFFNSYTTQPDAIAAIFTEKLLWQYVDFTLLEKYNSDVKILKNELKKNSNIKNSKILENAFLKQMIIIMVDNKDSKSNISKCLFILKNYMFALDKNSFKTLIKYSFFK